MNSMLDVIHALDKYIFMELEYPYPITNHNVEILTDSAWGIYLKVDNHLQFFKIHGPLSDLVDARNYLLYGKAVRTNTGNVDTNTNK